MEESTDDGGGVEALVTELGVNSRGELYTRLRHQGLIHFPKWKHVFPTKILGVKERGVPPNEQARFEPKLARVQEVLNDDPVLSDYPQRLKERYWLVQQVYAPITAKERLPKEFVRGHYTQQARWQLANPGCIVTLDDKIQRALAERQRLEGLVHDEAKLQEEITSVNKKLDERLTLTYKQRTKSRKEKVLRVEMNDHSFLKEWRMPTTQEFHDEYKVLFFDIEIPYFRRPNPEVRWVGMAALHGNHVEREIHTVNEFPERLVKGYHIITYPNEENLVRGFTKRVNEFDPDVIGAYNTRFDLIKMRETSQEFRVGAGKTNPLYKVTSPFFERIGLKDRLVLDPMRLQKIGNAHEVNAKFVMAVGEEKSETYDEMEENESANPLLNAEYLSGDVEGLVTLWQSERQREWIGEALFLADAFANVPDEKMRCTVGLERVLHTPNAINEAQQKDYFINIGLYRELVPPNLPTTKMKARESAARERFTKAIREEWLRSEAVKGRVKGVVKTRVPIGYMLRAAVLKRFAHANVVYQRMQEAWGDKERLRFLEAYAYSLAKYVITDYGFFLKDVDRMRRLTKQLPHDEFEEHYHAFRDELKAKDREGLERLNEAKLTRKHLDPYVDADVKAFLKEHDVSLEDFLAMANRRSHVKRTGRRFLGNYALYPSRRYFRPEKHELKGWGPPLILEDILEEKFGVIHDFIDKHELRIVAREGLYVYVTGEKRDVLYERRSPLIPCDEIPVLYHAQKPYYAKLGFYNDVKLKDEPDFHHTMFEMRTLRSMLDHLLAGENNEAVRVYHEALRYVEEELDRANIFDHSFYNKSKGWYTFYTRESEHEQGKTFVQTSHDDDIRRLASCPITGLPFFEAEERKEKLVRVHVTARPGEHFSLDPRPYRKRLEKRAGGLLAPLNQDPGEREPGFVRARQLTLG